MIYWYEIYYKGKDLMQIEFKVPVEEMIETIKEFAPEFDEKVLDQSSLECVMKAVGEKSLYYGPDPNF